MLHIWENYAIGKSLYSRLIEPVCKKYQLTQMEFNILMFLANNPQFNTATDIVETRRLSKSHVSISLRSLQERGYIAGEYLGRNHRTIYLKLCDTALEIISEGREAQQQFTSVLTADFTPEELDTLKDYLNRITNNISTYSSSNLP